MKIYVYAISKNESDQVDGFVDSMSESDGIFVMDTGSTDGTLERLMERGVSAVYDEIKPWRFDVARNKSLEYVPKDADICVCVDLDERFSIGWRDAFKQAWNSDKDINRLACRYVWNQIEVDGKQQDGYVYLFNKFHSRYGFYWKYPCHETLTPLGQEKEAIVSGAELRHYPKYKKERSNYLPLLEIGYNENQDDLRCIHYLGREYYYNARWEDSINILSEYVLKSGNFCWHDELSESYLIMATCYKHLNDEKNAELCAYRAIAESGGNEPEIWLSEHFYSKKNWTQSLFYAQMAMSIKQTTSHLRNPFNYGAKPYDLACIAAWNLGKKDLSIEYAKKCLEYEPNNERIKTNLQRCLL